MEPNLQAVDDVLEDLRRQVFRLVDDMTDEEVNRRFPDLKNTVGILLRHVAASERYWIVGVVGGGSRERSRDAEFGHDPLEKSALLDDLHRVQGETRRILARLREEDLGAPVEVQRASAGTVTVTRAWALLHALQHLAYHLGQLRLMSAMVRAARGRVAT